MGRKCTDCGERPPYASGLCRRCYTYLWRTGRHRDHDLRDAPQISRWHHKQIRYLDRPPATDDRWWDRTADTTAEALGAQGEAAIQRLLAAYQANPDSVTTDNRVAGDPYDPDLVSACGAGADAVAQSLERRKEGE